MKDWKQIYKSEGSIQNEPSQQIIELVPLFKKEGVKKVLDHGCGTGRHVKYLLEQGFKVVGTDHSEIALKYAKELTVGLNNVDFIKTEMDDIPYEDEYFDAVICSHVIQHGLSEKRDKAFYEMVRVLKSNGLLFLRTISREHKGDDGGKEVEPWTFVDIPELKDGKNPHHYFSEEELKRYLDGFEIISLRHSHSGSNLNFGHSFDEWVILAKKV